MAQTRYATMLVWTVLVFLDHFDRKKKERKKEDNSPLLDLLGFAAVKNCLVRPITERISPPVLFVTLESHCNRAKDLNI